MNTWDSKTPFYKIPIVVSFCPNCGAIPMPELKGNYLIMKAEIDEDGTLIITAKKGIESFALSQWMKKNINPCSGGFICDKPYQAMQIYPYVKKQITLFQRIKFKIQYFLYK